jgi:hypothetical protein
MEENVTLNHGDPGSSPGLTTNPEIALMVERELEELRVGGSNPSLGASSPIAQRKSAGPIIQRSRVRAALGLPYSQIAQLEERRTLNPEVAGSSPALAANRDQLEEWRNSPRSHRGDCGFNSHTGHHSGPVA